MQRICCWRAPTATASGTAAYADTGLHTHTGRGAAYNAQLAGAIRAAGLPVRFITPSEYERANLMIRLLVLDVTAP